MASRCSLKALLLVAGFAGLLALGGCPLLDGGGGTPEPNCPECPEPNCPEPNLPPESTLVDVHLFKYDTATKEYVLGNSRVSETEVQRDLVGALCGKCHQDKAAEFKETVHYKWASRNPNVLFPGGGAHGMIDRACGLPASTGLINFLSDVNMDECAKCHPGRYMPMMEGMFATMFEDMGIPNPQEQATRIIDAGLDCLICHSESYRAYPAEGEFALADYAQDDAISPTPEGFARIARDDTDFDHDGTPDPVIDSDGDGTPDMALLYDADGDGTPETPWPTVAQDRSFEAVSSLGETSDETCLRCHEHARTGYKRGTLFRPGHDIHSDSAAVGAIGGGENRHCVACHDVEHHKFQRGFYVGGDLMATDYEVDSPENDLTCTKCHEPSALPGLYHTEIHLAMMSCETCHIPYSSGITYSLYGHGGQLNFSRTADGLDTKLIVADHLLDGRTDEDVNADWEAYKVRPVYVWFNGNVSFLAQSLAVKGTPGAKITPFKPMGNGMVFDARFFDGTMATNDAMGGAYQYNAHTMYRFMAGGANADVFAALDFLDLTPDEVRQITLDDFNSTDQNRQAMALMQIYPNLVYFDKATFDIVRYATGSNSPWDADNDGYVDVGSNFYYDMLAAANMGLRKFQGFNVAMGLDAGYQWYPEYENADDLISMKVPDGTLIKMFLAMQGMSLPPEQQPDYFAAIANYPAFSNGITLGGHGVRPKEEALGAAYSCQDCHASGGVFDTPIPVTNTETRDIPGMGTFEFPLYRWKYYNFRALTDLGLTTQCEDIVAGTADVDIAGDTTYVRESSRTFVVNYLDPAGEGSYRPADDAASLEGTGLGADDISYNGGDWMPVLEPDVRLVPNIEVLGLDKDTMYFLD